MIDRRKLLIGAGAAAAYGLSPGLGRSSDATAAAIPAPAAGGDAEQLLYELARMEARYYTEEGVAMVLACENLAANPDGEPPDSFEPGEINEVFSSAFRQYSAQLGELRRDLTGQDAVAILEYLAWLDLAGGGAAP